MGSRRRPIGVTTTTTMLLGCLAAGLAAAGCSSDSKLAMNSELGRAPSSISVTSPAFNSGGMIPIKYTQDGENVSPPIEWSGAPGGTREFVLVVQDPDAPGDDPYLHWFV